MLRKEDPLKVDVDNPFAGDKLKRSEAIQNLTTLVKSARQPFVISINGRWGSGKTTFVKMWKAQLEQEGHHCIMFNAWENDFVEDPLVALVGELESSMDAGRIALSDCPQAAQAWNKVRTIGSAVLRRGGPLLAKTALKVATQGMFGNEKLSEFGGDLSDDLSDEGKDLVKERIGRYQAEKQGMRKFRENLASFAALVCEGDSGVKPPLVIFVDELDRCRPDFAVRLLERIKHLFCVSGIVFVLSIDRSQIVSSVQAIYGRGLDGQGYLRRFIDIEFLLPDFDYAQFCGHLWDRFALDEPLKNRRLGRVEKSTLLEVFSQCAGLFQFSLRTLEQCFTQFNIALRCTPSDHHIVPEFLGFLTALKAGEPDVYAQYVKGEIGGCDVEARIAKSDEGKSFLDKGAGFYVATLLIVWSLKEGEFDAQWQEWQRLESDDSSDSKLRKLARDKVRIAGEINNYYPRSLLPYLANKLEYTERLVSN